MKCHCKVEERIREEKVRLESEREYMNKLEEQGAPQNSDAWRTHNAIVWQLRDTIAALEWVLRE